LPERFEPWPGRTRPQHRPRTCDEGDQARRAGSPALSRTPHEAPLLR
jgi:hypothetical protein